MPGQEAINKVIYNGNVLMDLTADTVVANKLLTGFTAHGADGKAITGTCAFDVDSSAATALATEILNTKTAAVGGVVLTGSMPNNGAVDGSITTVAGTYTVPLGYHDGSGTVAIAATEQAKLIATNIREGITVLGITGTMSGTEGANPQTVTVTPTASAQEITPDASQGYNYLASVTINAIPYTETSNAQGGKTVAIATSA